MGRGGLQRLGQPTRSSIALTILPKAVPPHQDKPFSKHDPFNEKGKCCCTLSPYFFTVDYLGIHWTCHFVYSYAYRYFIVCIHYTLLLYRRLKKQQKTPHSSTRFNHTSGVRLIFKNSGPNSRLRSFSLCDLAFSVTCFCLFFQLWIF